MVGLKVRGSKAELVNRLRQCNTTKDDINELLTYIPAKKQVNVVEQNVENSFNRPQLDTNMETNENQNITNESIPFEPIFPYMARSIKENHGGKIIDP